MRKQIDFDAITTTFRSIDSIAVHDAIEFLGLNGKDKFTIDEQRKIRSKKRKIITSDKKNQRRIKRELLKNINTIIAQETKY